MVHLVLHGIFDLMNSCVTYLTERPWLVQNSWASKYKGKLRRHLYLRGNSPQIQLFHRNARTRVFQILS